MDNAELYARASATQRQFTASALQQLWPALDWHSAGRCVVLDVGCGPGDVTATELLPRLPPGVGVVASDLSPAMLAKAASRYAGRRLCFCQLDIGTHQLEETVAWQLGPYSKVFSFFCLFWVPDQRHVLKNINKLLSPGGEAVLIIVSFCKVHGLYETLGQTQLWGPYMQDFKRYVTPYQYSKDPEGDLRTFLQEAGFRVKTCRNHSGITYSSSEEQDIIDTITAINPFVEKLPSELRGPFMRDLLTAAYGGGALSATPTPAGTCYSFGYDALVAHAVKE